MSGNEKYIQLRKQYKTFCYEDFLCKTTNEGWLIKFRFSAGEDIVFEPETLIPHRPFIDFGRISLEQKEMLIFQMGMVELISYWKSVCSPKVIIKPFNLGHEEISFWKKMYFNGLGEFFYVNGIDASYDDFMEIESHSEKKLKPLRFDVDANSYLVPIGGGKDSVVTLEILRKAGVTIHPLIINPRGATTQCAEIGGFGGDDIFEFRRTIHPRLLQLNTQGYLNGHTPFSAMLAFYTLLALALTGYGHVALSNENSANEATVIGTSVNHQYSKSFEFENDFREYVRKFVSPDFDYFSFLRPFSELQIAMLFAENHQYFEAFRSCNAGSKENIWCGKCPKCLFAYIILSPFIEPETMAKIFGKDLLDDTDLQQYFDELTGLLPTKPFECVGTIDEVKAALAMTKKRFYKNTQAPMLLANNDENCPLPDLEILSPDHNLPQSLADTLQKEIEKVCRKHRQLL